MVENATGPRLSAFARRFRDDRGGLAALEFALVAPMMFLVLFMSFELTDAMAANRRAEVTASSLADVISRDVVVSDDEIRGLFAAIPLLTRPTDPVLVQARVTSIFIDASGQATVRWSEGSGMAPLPEGSPVTIPVGMQVPETGLVMGETVLNYEPPLGLFSMAPFVISKTEYRRPRIADPVLRN